VRSRIERATAISLGLVVALICGAVQVASMSVYGDLASRPSVPASLPASLGLRVARPLGAPAAPAFARAAYARALLHTGNAEAAVPIIAALPASSTTDDLRGQLAQALGRPTDALRAYARAGDIERAQTLIDDRVAAGDLASAAGFERELVDVLAGDARAAVRARAWWRLGQITQLAAVAAPADRLAAERTALDDYVRALAIAPNEETYLLAAGQQALNIGDKPLAERFYRRALDVVPASADARAGLDRARS